MDLAKKLGMKVELIIQRVADLHEFNPMLGHRGCRLGVAYPEITEMQARAIFEAAADVAKKKIKVKPEVMIPLVGFKREFDLQAEIVHKVAKQVMAEKKVTFEYQVGTMIEVPRGALTADQIAEGLLEIVRDSALSAEERDEALAHGLNLDFGIFGILAADPMLPLPLAQRYFDELANRNEMPRQQIEGYLGLMSHNDEELRILAAQQLAFVLENEDLAEAPADLRRLALEKLEALKLEAPEQNPAVTEPPANGQRATPGVTGARN